MFELGDAWRDGARDAVALAQPMLTGQRVAGLQPVARDAVDDQLAHAGQYIGAAECRSIASSTRAISTPPRAGSRSRRG